LESTTRWHRAYEIAGFVALGLLLLFEILSYIYGNRRDTLSVEIELKAAQTRQRDDQLANQRRDAEIAEARRQANEARDAQAAAQQKIDTLTATRTLSDDQKRALIKALSPYKGSEIIIRSAQGNKECQDYADQFRQVFQQSGWTFPRAPFRIVTHEGENVQILVANTVKPPPRAVAIQAALKEIGIEAPGSLDNSVEADVVQLYIGFKVDKHAPK
jgi:hypothetical protein